MHVFYICLVFEFQWLVAKSSWQLRHCSSQFLINNCSSQNNNVFFPKRLPQSRIHWLHWWFTNVVIKQTVHWRDNDVTSIQHCRGRLLGQRFVPTGCGRDPLQDEDHSGSRPHSFPGYFSIRSGWAPEWLRSTPVAMGSSESHQVAPVHLECGFPFC